MAIVYSTEAVHPRDRLHYWVEAASKAFVRHELAAPAGSSFSASVRMGPVGGLGVAVFECAPCEVTRSARDVAQGDSDDFILCLQLVGRANIRQDDRRTVNEAASFTFLDARRPFAVALPDRSKNVSFRIDRQALSARLGNVEAMTARAITPHGPLSGLASSYLATLAARFDSLDGVVGIKLAEQALDLIALAISEEVGRQGVSLSTARATALFRLKSVIEARLRDPELRPTAAAAEAGISVRYANALLSQEGFSVERYILHRRLERCRQALEDRAQAARMISEIAFAWGFSDLSHFSRRFRTAYGLTPGDCRRRAQERMTAGEAQKDDEAIALGGAAGTVDD